MSLDWPILVLTLEGDDERRQPLLDALNDADLSYQLVIGVDGRRGLSAEYQMLVDRDTAQTRTGRPLSDGEFACALSHRQIYHHILESDLPGAIILEDDAIIQPGFAEFIRSRQYQRVPMVLLDFGFGRALPFRRIRVAGGDLRRATQATMTNAYSVSANVAGQLFRATTPVTYFADWPVDLYHLKAWLMAPRLVTHEAPGQGQSHLEIQRAALAKTASKASRNERTLAERFRRRLSVRVGRAKGQR